MTPAEFKTQTGLLWDDRMSVLPPFVSSPMRGYASGPDTMAVSFTLRCEAGTPPAVEDRTVRFELRNGRFELNKGDDVEMEDLGSMMGRRHAWMFSLPDSSPIAEAAVRRPAGIDLAVA